MGKSIKGEASEVGSGSKGKSDERRGIVHADVSGAASKPRNKRVLANERTKRRIIRALLRLMNEKHFSDITVSDIVARAGVARASYYRNFSSKEDVIASAGAIIIDDFRQKTVGENRSVLEYESILRMFRYFRAYRAALLTLHRAGFTALYLSMFSEFIEDVAGDMPYDDIRRYCLPFYSGAAFSVFVAWLEEGMKESPEEMAGLFHRMVEGAVAAI